MTLRTDIVVTTIFEPAWLEGYLRNLRKHGRDADTTIRIICDRKTPQSVYAAARQAESDGFRIDCPNLDEQERYLSKLGLTADFIPWNTDNRRNIGFLKAWESGADLLISIDDDNYCKDDSDFVGEHAVVGATVGELAGARYASGGTWFNICELLELNTAAPVFARGFPYRARDPKTLARAGNVPDGAGVARIALNAGLWLDDPDVDAITRLSIAPRAAGASPDAVILGPEAWSPINTQNTGLLRESMPAYYYVRMGYPLQGLRIDRFGDILSGYFVQKCAKHLGHAIRLGSPVADHRRTPHNLFKDLYHELAGVVLVEDLLPWLQEARLSGGNYVETYAALADALESQSPKFSGFVWDEGGRAFLAQTAAAMRQWLGVIRNLG